MTNGAPATGPVSASERIVALDVLRGVAVLGILITNIQHYSMFAGAVRDPSLYGNLEGANFLVYAATFTLAYQKFLPIFSMLLGAGIVLSAERREAAGEDPMPLHVRRMVVLLLIGLVHAYFIWYGDILVTYAICGTVAFLARRQSPGTLLGLGVGSLAATPLILIVIFVLPSLLGWRGDSGFSFEQVVADDLAAFRGPWIDQLRMRASYAFESQTIGLAAHLFWKACGLMWIGMALCKMGILTGRRSRTFYAVLVVVALAIALPVTAGGLWLRVATGWRNFPARLLTDQIIYWFGIVMSLGYTGIVMLACGGGCRGLPSRMLAAVGRMALTNYLMQSLLCTFLFYGHGLGLYGSVERTGQAGIVAAVWAIQLILSPIWLSRFRYGPAEWLWRSASYGQVQPFRIRPAAAMAPEG